MIDFSFVFMIVGFMLAAYAVIANDSIQTLGTFLESNKKIAWWKLAAGASLIAVVVISYSRVVNTGDISRGRLATKGIEFPETFTIRHALAPLALLFLTRFGIPVSTSLLVLSVFSTAGTIGKMVTKSMLGYIVAFVVAYFLWIAIFWSYKKLKKAVKARVWNKRSLKTQHRRILQVLSTGYLWSVWLMHDMANIAVYLPRNMHIGYLIFTLLLVVSGLFYIFWKKGGKIQNIVSSKSNTDYIISATIIDFVYACILLYFKQMNSIPMSTTWVFVGLLAGREIALSHFGTYGKALAKVFPMIIKDFLKVFFGLVISVGLAYAVGSLSGM